MKFQHSHIILSCLATMSALVLSSCKTQQKATEPAQFVHHEPSGEHSPSVFIVMYDKESGREPLLKAIKAYKAEIIYDYNIITGMAIKKPDDKTLEEAMQYFRKVKGVLSVDYDRVTHLTDPVKPKLEVQ